MKTQYSTWLQQAFTFLLWGLIFYLAGLPSLKFDTAESPVVIIWFPAGVAVAAFMCSYRRDYPLLIVIFTLMTAFLDKQWGSQLPFAHLLLEDFLSIPLTVAIAWIVRHFARMHDDLHIILVWIVATLVISCLDSLIVGSGYAIVQGLPPFSNFWHGFIANVTGIFFATPVVMGVLNRHERFVTNSLLLKSIGFILWLVMCAITGIIFDHDFSKETTHAPGLYFFLICLPVLVVMLLSLFWGRPGGSLALLTFGAIVIYNTSQDKGPFFLKSFVYTESLLLALSYLSVTALLVVFIRVIRCFANNRDSVSQVAFYRLTPATGEIHWDNMHSCFPDNLQFSRISNVEDVLKYIHPRDKEKLYTHWFSPSHQSSILFFRIQTTNGQWVTLADQCAMHTVVDGKNIVVGYWQVSRFHLAY
ncbi:histidine kinase [Escherichia coli]|uniref:MASE1 domain-containing protein n=1 Tax=Escherichia coli TaxID=562 RepID=UPI000BEA55BD|nr:MASE1 domain-containing protein [Escherichia coli]EEV6025743.1 histidine kinase [Escherichia coli]EFA4352282.1 histidine kinase [Escherichia coli]EFA6128155.1 histidine kinase [Escherichia coli]EFC3436745.1 histidine kinase [Escherichia coli]EFC4774160.1 histidine kinase [Escherichia coli]